MAASVLLGPTRFGGSQQLSTFTASTPGAVIVHSERLQKYFVLCRGRSGGSGERALLAEIAGLCSESETLLTTPSVVSGLRPFLEHQLMTPPGKGALAGQSFTAVGDGPIHRRPVIGLALG